MFMTVWEQLGRDHLCLARWTNIGTEWVTIYYKKMHDSSAYVITMCELKIGFICHLIT